MTSGSMQKSAFMGVRWIMLGTYRIVRAAERSWHDQMDRLNQ